ncbi:MAG: hypothetical protein FJY85_20860, partial [Deltaproteobacteria bacterium]|nr:hypothetical protein [Deltaproteobacteria bacterium]
MKSYLKEVVSEEIPQERGTRRKVGDSLFSELTEDYKELKEELEDWERAWQHVEDAREELRRLLKGEWCWNSDHHLTPNKELKKVRSSLEEAQGALGKYQPLEVDGALHLTKNLERAVREISEPFETFRRRFDEDDFDEEEHFSQAKEALETLQQKLEQWERDLDRDIWALGRDRPTINLGRFFRVRDVYGRARQTEDGGWMPGTAENICSLIEARTRLEERRRNWQAWQKWNQDAIQTLQGLQENLQNARKHLSRGCLGRAMKLCDDEISTALQKLDNLRRRTPEPPLCELALRAARNPGDLQPDPDSNDEVQRARERLRNALRVEMPIVWRQYLSLEVEAARHQLGPGPEGQRVEETLLDT